MYAPGYTQNISPYSLLGLFKRVQHYAATYTTPETENHLFYKSTVKSVLWYCLICWGRSLSAKSKVLLDRVVWSASKTIGTILPTVDELYDIIDDDKYKGHRKGHFSPSARILLWHHTQSLTSRVYVLAN